MQAGREEVEYSCNYY